LLLDPGHPHCEKLIEVGTERAKEFETIQQWRGRVQGLFQDALVVLKPAQFPIEQVGRFKFGRLQSHIGKHIVPAAEKAMAAYHAGFAFQFEVPEKTVNISGI
jgi:hypothetical protein